MELEDRLKSLLAENMVNDDVELSEPIQDFGNNFTVHRCVFQKITFLIHFLISKVGVPIDEVKAHRAAQKIVEQLHHIGYARNHMKKYGYKQILTSR